MAPPRIRGTDEQGERRMRAADQQDDSWDVCLVPAVSPGLRPSRGPHKHTATLPEDRVSPPTIRPLVLPSARPEETGRLRTSHTSPGSQPDGRQAWAWLCLCPPAPHPAAAPRDRAWPWTVLRHHLRPAGAPVVCSAHRSDQGQRPLVVHGQEGPSAWPCCPGPSLMGPVTTFINLDMKSSS